MNSLPQRILFLGLTPLLSPAGDGLLFLDQGAAAGVDDIGFGRGAAWVDLDGDGRLDIVAADSAMRVAFLRQLPDQTFESAAGAWNVPATAADAWGVVTADFDEDGDPDLYLPRGGWSGPRDNLLLVNELNTLGRIYAASNLGDAAVASASFGATALDYDRDGDVDLFVSNRQAPDGGPGVCTLLRNDGNLIFRDVSAAAGIVHSGLFTHCSAGDLDNDGWPEIAVGGLDGPNLLYHNQGDGTFVEVAQAAGVGTPGQNYGLVFDDFDNDGWMDLWSPKYHGIGELFLNAGDGSFARVDVEMPAVTDMGHNSGDLDGDGYPDLYIGTGGPEYPYDDVLLLVRPDAAGGLTLTDASESSGILASGPTRSHGCPFGDYDRDGDIDFFANNGGPEWISFSAQESYLWQNQGNGSRWLAVGLEGRLSNRSGIGTRGVVSLPTGRQIHRHRTAGKGFANSDASELHFGLGAAPFASQLELRWPSGVVQVLESPQLDTRTLLVETGLVVSGAAQLGATLTLEVCGSSAATVELTGILTPPIGLPRPIEGLPDVPDLGPSGVASAALVLPSSPALAGSLLELGAQITAPGSGVPTVTPTIALVLE